MRVQVSLILAGPGQFAGRRAWRLFRSIQMIAAIVRIERNSMNDVKIVRGVRMGRGRRGHAVLHERNHKDRRRYRTQELHGSGLYQNC